MRLRMALGGGFVAGALVVAAAVAAVQVLDGGNGAGPTSAGGVATAPATAMPAADGVTRGAALAADCLSAADIFESVRPAVVAITSTLGSLGRFGQQEEGGGSGVVIDDQGHILTNHHVIDGARSIEVRFSDGSVLPATVAGSDAANDLAVIKVDPLGSDLAAAPLGDSSALRVGDPVLAIGNPFSLEGTLTQGIVSALDRSYSTGQNTRPLRHMIQTDAAVNPGNSGGPLLNCTGEVIGINTLLENPTGQNVNVGVAFAVSINTAKQSMSAMLAGESVEHPWLGIAGVDVTPAVADELGLGVETGVYVTLVSDGSPASEAGLRAAFQSAAALQNSSEPRRGGDVITAADGRRMAGIDDLASYLDENKSPGDTVRLTVVRDGGEIAMEARLADWPS